MPVIPVGSARRLGIAILAFVMAGLLLPTVAADGDPVTVALEVVAEVSESAGDTVEGFFPACPGSDPQWIVECQDGKTMAACGTDAEVLYRCRLFFESHGGDMDGRSVAILADAAGRMVNEGEGRAFDSEQHLVGAGLDLKDEAVQEEAAWQAWTTAKAIEVVALTLAAKDPYQDAAKALLIGVQTESLSFAGRTADDATTKALEGLNQEATEYRFVAGFDSGPVTVRASDQRSMDDECNPGAGIRLFGEDCDGRTLVSGRIEASLACNAYTTIALAQPCGGYVSHDWNWAVNGALLYPRLLEKARLSFGADGSVSVHDALGVLHCGASPGNNGYWLQTFYLQYAQTVDGQTSPLHHNENGASVFGDDAGSCSITSWGDSFEVTYDVMFNGAPIQMTGRFAPESGNQDLANCDADADARTGSCHSVVHNGSD